MELLHTSGVLILLLSPCCFSAIRSGIQTEPPPPVYGFQNDFHYNVRGNEIRVAVESWTDSSEDNVWERSGYYEGDIMLNDDVAPHHIEKNALLNETMRWTNSSIPFYIDETDFDDDEVKIILQAVGEYHKSTCVRFRPYSKTDENYIVVKGNSTGCWSSVGMKTGGQVLHLQKSGCVRNGVVIHEFLHALGLFHQQSATERDEFVQIRYENIMDGREHNFNKYNASIVTSFDIPYDYQSIMHYSEKAFSKNGEKTIVPLKPDAKIGQREGLSESDILKINKMYEPIFCHKKDKSSEVFDPFQAILEWFLN